MKKTYTVEKMNQIVAAAKRVGSCEALNLILESLREVRACVMSEPPPKTMEQIVETAESGDPLRVLEFSRKVALVALSEVSKTGLALAKKNEAVSKAHVMGFAAANLAPTDDPSRN